MTGALDFPGKKPSLSKPNNRGAHLGTCEIHRVVLFWERSPGEFVCAKCYPPHLYRPEGER